MHENKTIALNIVDLSQATVDIISLPELEQRQVRVEVLRLDKIHAVISGNKWFKLKNHLQQAAKSGARQILTFGGAWSNHIIAAAYATNKTGIPSIGIIRGEKPARLSATLQAATAYGMHLEFISREDYGAKEDPAYLNHLAEQYPGAYLVPEGGAGTAGITGSSDILDLIDKTRYSHILCAMGTGTMYLGLAAALLPGQTLLGIPVLKGMDDLSAFCPPDSHRENYPATEKLNYCQINAGYHFGGYARFTAELLDFMNGFYKDTGIPSDFVYTGKLFFGTMDMARKGIFPPGSRLLLIHSGGLQGNQSLPGGTLYF